MHDVSGSLPVPVDDGAADYLLGSKVPSLSLRSTLGDQLDLAEAARGLLAIYVYPRTGRAGEPLPEGWDEIPAVDMGTGADHRRPKHHQSAHSSS